MKKYNPESLMAARRFVIASEKVKMPAGIPLSAEVQRELIEFDDSLLGLVRAAISEARDNPSISPDELPERWSPVAEHMIKVVCGIHGNRDNTRNIFGDFRVDEQRELYELVTQNSTAPAE